MYRNVYYDNFKSTMHLWHWNKDGEPIHSQEPFKPYIYLESSEEGEYKSIYNTDVRKVEFKNGFERNKYLANTSIKRIFYNLKPEQQFLIEKYMGLNNKDDFAKHPIDICFLDIEIYTCKYPLNTFVEAKIDGVKKELLIEDIISYGYKNIQVLDREDNLWKDLSKSCYTQTSEFPTPEEAKYPVNVITIYSTLKKKFITWGLMGEYTPKQDNVTYIRCHSEKQLLTKFLDYWDNNYPDIISGWNSQFFDEPYLVNRITQVLSENDAKRLSPVRNLYYKQSRGFDRFGNDKGKWVFGGLTSLDYMDVYKKFARGERGSYSLNFIAEYELNEGKVKYNATDLSKLAITDWETFIDYNIQDVNILVRLEETLKYIKLIRNIAYKGLSSYVDSLGTVSVVTGVMAISALKRGTVIPTFKVTEKSNFEGGFVMEPKRGLQESIVSFDANSLYPNTIITLNLSPETKLGKIIDKSTDTIKIRLIDGNEYDLSREKFKEFIRKSQASISKSGVLFSQKTKGFCPAVIEELYNERVEVRKKNVKVSKKLVQLEKKEKTPQIEEAIQKLKEKNLDLDTFQYVIKIFMNSIYGAMSTPFSPFYDIDLASSITLTGQACVKQAGIIVNDIAKEQYDCEDILIYSDTDSAYLTIDPILKNQNLNLLEDGKVTEPALKICEGIEKDLNERINTWSKKILNSTDSRFVFKREAICDTGLFLQKKRYILNVKNDEGIDVNKMKFTGVEVARSSYSDPVKTLIKDIIKTVFETKDNTKTNLTYKECFERFKELSIDDISIRMGLKDYDKYASKSKKLKIALHTPVHVKAGIYYNYLLKSHKIDTKYEKIRSGSKVKWFYCEKNKYDMNVLAYLDEMPEEILQEIKPDYKKMFEKLVTKSIERVFDACEWKMDDLTYDYNTNLTDFLS